jgi:hypothetical protein
MAQQPSAHVENNFTGGLKTEYTGLNFPENACTEVDNCVFSVIGDIERRKGIDYELNHELQTVSFTDSAVSTYNWHNAGGNGLRRILVKQVGATLYFYESSAASSSSSLSANKLVSTINLNTYATVSGSLSVARTECQYAAGNGYLFVFHPDVETLYCIYTAGTITANTIIPKIRDFNGVYENINTQTRPASLTDIHTYNLFNQGWSSSPDWTATSVTSVVTGTGSKVFTVAGGLPIVLGTQVTILGYSEIPGAVGAASSLSGTVTGYSGTTLTVNVTSFTGSGTWTSWTIDPFNVGLISTWNTDIGNYPSNADIWWRFKDKDGLYDPATTASNITLGSGPARKGFYIITAFDQNRSVFSGIPGLTSVTTTVRPKTGTWFQGRLWFSGVDASKAASADQLEYTWSESIYFSQIVITPSEFGNCYQTNDPTSEEFADLLPSDGGVIVIQGSGSIIKLFPVQNGLLVFASNGIWFITGSQGIGFTAIDHTITKISSIKTLSATSFIDLLGYPLFWNEEGIYLVRPDKDSGGLAVDNLCQGTILSFYLDIPSASKRYARGDYDSNNFTISWLFKDTEETSISDRYSFNRVLNYNTSTKAFYPYTIDTSIVKVRDLKYVDSLGSGKFKYLVTSGTTCTFAEERDDNNWVDFVSYNGTGFDYDSYFITGYKLYGKALTKFQPVYFQMFSRANIATSYKIQGIWDYANDPNSGKYSTIQLVTNALTRFGVLYRRHRIRGHGLSMQLKVSSISGMPFSIIGWSSLETINAGM